MTALFWMGREGLRFCLLKSIYSNRLEGPQLEMT